MSSGKVSQKAVAAPPHDVRPPARRRGRPKRGEQGHRDDELLTQALDHFLEKGFEGTTLSAIAASLQMSKQTIYARYSDKLTLFRAVLQRAIDSWLVPLRHLEVLETDDLEESLISIGRRIVETMMSANGQKLIRITNAESYRMPEIGDYTYKRGHQLLGLYLQDLFKRRLSPASSDAELEDLATALLNTLSSPARIHAWGLGESNMDIGRFVERRVRLFLHGVDGIASVPGDRMPGKKSHQ